MLEQTKIRLERLGLIPVLRAGSVETANALVDAMMAGGVDVIEVTMTISVDNPFLKQKECLLAFVSHCSTPYRKGSHWEMGILDQFRLDGKLALVTGSASGLGAAIAIALAEAGASVACHGNRRPADETATKIRALGRESQSFASDLGATGGADFLDEAVSSAMGKPDILVNNAGTIYRDSAENYDLPAWMNVMQVNLNSVFRLCQLTGRAMLERRQGKIINIASLLSFQGGIRVAAYAASKGGVAQLTKALANEWACRNIQVNAIAPGYFRTENTSALQADEIRNRRILERIPAGRWGEPEDIAGAAVFLASPASNYVNGEVLVADGGWMAR